MFITDRADGYLKKYLKNHLVFCRDKVKVFQQLINLPTEEKPPECEKGPVLRETIARYNSKLFNIVISFFILL